MLGSIWPTLIMCTAYVFIVTVLGPRFMRNRKPFNISTFLVYYNLLQVILSAYIFITVRIFNPLVSSSFKQSVYWNSWMIFLLNVLWKKNLFLQLLFAGWGGDYSFRCQPVDYSDNPKALLVSIKEALVLQPHTRILIAAVFLWSSEKRVSLAPVHFYFLSSLLQFQMLHACYMYYLSKFTEFIDTVSKTCDKRLF